jgi:hypothetical protein
MDQTNATIIAAAVALRMAGVAVSSRRSAGRLVRDHQAFETVRAAVPVCNSGGDCQPVAPALIEQTVRVIEDSGPAKVVEIQDAEEVADEVPTDDGSPPPDEFVQSLASRVVFRVSETSDPTPLFRDLVALPFMDSVHLSTAEAPNMWVGGALGEQPPPNVERVEYRTLDVPVAGSDETVTYSTYRNNQGQLCVQGL